MELKNSLIASVFIHLLVILFLPGLKLNNQLPSWVEVSVIKFPDIKEKVPQWRTGKKAFQEPSREVPQVKKNDLPVPVEEEYYGVPLEMESPDISDLIELEEIDPVEDIEKVVPGEKGMEGAVEGLGEDEGFVISGPVINRDVINAQKPKYPDWALKRGIEGEVVVKFWVSPEGMVTSVELVKTSGYPGLDSRAIESVKRYLFAPLGKDEEQEMQWGERTLKFYLNK
jgi:protein TonB